MDLEQEKVDRFRYLEDVYAKAGQTRFKGVSIDDVARDLGFDPAKAQRIRDYLANDGVLKGHGFRTVTITHEGIKAVEKARSGLAEAHMTQETRMRLLKAGYIASRKDKNRYFESNVVAKALGISDAEAEDIMRYFLEKSWVRMEADGDLYSFTAAGIDVMERGSFSIAPVSTTNHIQVGGNFNGSIQQAGSHSVQSATVTVQTARQLAPLITQLKEEIEKLELPPEVREPVDSFVSAMTMHVKHTPAPKKSLLRELLASTRAILEGAVSSLAATGLPVLMANIDKLLF